MEAAKGVVEVTDIDDVMVFTQGQRPFQPAWAETEDGSGNSAANAGSKRSLGVPLWAGDNC
jgi:hypothetical protein